ncbi:hypothetical protein Cgig2_014674 [Carnegiea gigantea]|uniref:S-acyltransferase n=1 Tax=Carnegiea gigantea TaxID=171969 RepID=A0A9Q1QTF3_9CARY|nr:hypothetical protein Cgig2_014674 [Carnegiea gigantea]
MSSSEIEIVSDSITRNGANQPAKVSNQTQQVTINDVYGASAYGDFEKLRKFVEEDGASLSEPDSNGYYAIQWAALNNFPHIVQYIIEVGVWAAFIELIPVFPRRCLKHGGDVNAADNSGQTALHWAAVRGCIAVADVLLQNGARIEAADFNGYRAVHVAAQFGQTAFLNHIIAKYNADFDAPDNDGRSPLHWAAYKGFADTVRLLLFRDASQGRQDKEGCTPLHWAALTGHLEACSVLVHSGTKEELTVKDRAGSTPVQLASDKGHRQVALLLSNAQKAQSKRLKGMSCAGKVKSIGYAPFLFCTVIALMILFINSVLLGGKDPGYIKRSNESGDCSKSEDPLLNLDMNGSSVWTGNWSQLCPTCKIARNITTNEVANASRYSYLRGPDGRLRNPYNHGCRKNCADFLIKGHTDDNEIAWPPLLQVAH